MAGDYFGPTGQGGSEAGTPPPNLIDNPVQYWQPGQSYGTSPDESQAQADVATTPIVGRSFLTAALEAVGLTGYNGYSHTVAPTIPPWASPTFVPGVGNTTQGYFQRVDRAPATYYAGQDPTNPTQPTADTSDDMVYMGQRTTEGVPQPHIGDIRESGGSELAPATQANAITVGAALNLPYNWTTEHTTDVMKKMRAAGMNVKDFPSMMQAWQMLVERASRMFVLSNGQKEVTPWDVLSLVKKESKASGLLDHHGNVVHTTTQRSVDDFSDGQSWTMLTQAMENGLGRKPTDQEVRDYASRLNAIAARNPSVTTARTVTNQDTGQTHTSSHTSGGYTADDAMQQITNDVQNTDEYAQVQSATTYFNALLGALGETSPVTG